MIFLPIGGRLSVSSFSLWTPKNVAKTSVIGINIKDEQLLNSAKVLGSSVETSPFSYLGIPLGCNFWKRIVLRTYER